MVCQVRMPLCWPLYFGTWTNITQPRVASSIAIRRTLTILAFGRDSKVMGASSLPNSKTGSDKLLLESKLVDVLFIGAVRKTV